MHAFEKAYEGLNSAQRRAVDTLEGPVLVIAGPGTGKTQLLSARVANILQKTDTPPQNILCLTFTESGAANMRERLTRFIGQAAYNVTIGTYHSFGGDLIKRFPEYFNDSRLDTPIDDLTKRQILLAIVDAMPYDNPLKQSRYHLGDLMASISEVKRALLTPERLRAIAAENLAYITTARQPVQELLTDFKSMPGIKKAVPYFEQVLEALQRLTPTDSAAAPFGSLGMLVVQELAHALEEAGQTNKTTPLTAWKNKWLAKDGDNRFILSGELENRRIEAMASALEHYQAAMAERGLFDFDDMIIKAIEVLEQNDDLRYTLQEKYLYVLLDEFQDTNAAQLKLMQLLTNNPINEGRPNVLAVGDDDQAIYAFQGAQYSNMLDFLQLYRDVTVVNLTENYRSHADILHAAHNIAGQIEGRLDRHFPDMSKVLQAANQTLPEATIERVSFLSPIAERAWVAERIGRLVDDGTPASEIAVLAPKHKYLESLVPYLNAQGVAVRYEKRENILEASVVKQLTSMSRLVLALSEGQHTLANALWPEVLSYDFWNIPVETIWKTSWQAHDAHESWSKLLLDDPDTREPALLFLAAASKARIETCETMLDYLTGTVPLDTHNQDIPCVCSPLRGFCTSDQMQLDQPELFYDTVSHLSVLRARIREYQESVESALTLADFVAFIDMYNEAEQQIINTSPYNQQTDAVQLMTVYKAKGLEYEHVFILQCQDEVWGSTARNNSNKLTLPANLQPIRHAGATDDERLRLLFVAVTRAKQGLFLTSSQQQYSGKRSTRLKYFDEQEQADARFAAMVLPEAYRTVRTEDHAAPSLELMQLDWRTRHFDSLADISLRSLLADRLQSYQLSPTHLVAFIDLEYAGPLRFFFHTILDIPEAPTLDGLYGTAVHETLEWLQHQVSESGFLPPTTDILANFSTRITAKKLPDSRAAIEIRRGHQALRTWLEQRKHIFGKPAIVERSFRHEAVFVDDIHMAGRIDRMEIDEESKTITVVDYKTGTSYSSWKQDAKLHKYRLQLYCYKLLIEGSRTYRGYTVDSGRLEFIEPDEHGRIYTLDLTFEPQELERTRHLMRALWQHVHEVRFPDASSYPSSFTGIKQFEQDLLDGIV